MNFNLEWFKNEFEPRLIGYDLSYQHYNDDDEMEFVDKVDINGEKIGCEIMFYSDGSIYIFSYNYLEEKEIFNTSIDSNQEVDVKAAFEELERLLK
ncbi:MAG: hypothetical protein J0G96_03525 [Flavobacteriia bacterium]|nr:hypothetical protein [Flavobacteriia bacterium]OJX39286.1 MAG: hypothetical protein BGO87_04705 [Flavobacteriia bacterium 40-80]